MPVRRVIVDGRPGYRWGDRGKVYRYVEGDEASRSRAYALAAAQGAAARAAGYREDAVRDAPPRRPGPRELERVYTGWVRRWQASYERAILAAWEAWRRSRPARAPDLLRTDARPDDDDEEIDEILDEADAAELAYWTRKAIRAEEEKARRLAPPSTTALAAIASRGVRIAAEGQRSRLKATDPALWDELVRRARGNRRLDLERIDIKADPTWRELIERWQQENIDLIVTIPANRLANDGAWISERIREGAHVRELRDDFARRHGIDLRHARVIARDQTNKLSGNVSQAMQTAAGVSRYVWRTVQDERVRGNPTGLYPRALPSHYALDGTIQRWDSPPEVGPYFRNGHPGSAIQCRCYADPILDDDAPDASGTIQG